MSTIQEQSEKVKIALLVANTIWFSFWFVLIFVTHISPWWFLFPAILHWRPSDMELKKEEHE